MAVHRSPYAAGDASAKSIAHTPHFGRTATALICATLLLSPLARGVAVGQSQGGGKPPAAAEVPRDAKNSFDELMGGAISDPAEQRSRAESISKYGTLQQAEQLLLSGNITGKAAQQVLANKIYTESSAAFSKGSESAGSKMQELMAKLMSAGKPAPDAIAEANQQCRGVHTGAGKLLAAKKKDGTYAVGDPLARATLAKTVGQFGLYSEGVELLLSGAISNQEELRTATTRVWEESGPSQATELLRDSRVKDAEVRKGLEKIKRGD